ncbi:hypothetical protein B566_EDAN006912 [Ephemera danica]|nr:hypothetical protein B566_EDAN006912 [Ephemera danica]
MFLSTQFFRRLPVPMVLRTAIQPQSMGSRRHLGCHSASITKIHRATFSRVYPTILVLPDGSSIRIRYHEPRKIIKLPLDLSKLSEEEKRLRLERRKPRQKLQVMEDIEDSFDASQYLNLINK